MISRLIDKLTGTRRVCLYCDSVEEGLAYLIYNKYRVKRFRIENFKMIARCDKIGNILTDVKII